MLKRGKYLRYICDTDIKKPRTTVISQKNKKKKLSDELFQINSAHLKNAENQNNNETLNNEKT